MKLSTLTKFAKQKLLDNRKGLEKKRINKIYVHILYIYMQFDILSLGLEFTQETMQ